VLSQITTALALIIQVRGMSEHDFGVYSLLYTFITGDRHAAVVGTRAGNATLPAEYLRAGNKAGLRG